MELLKSQDKAKRKLLESSVVWTLEFGNLMFDFRIWKLDIRV